MGTVVRTRGNLCRPKQRDSCRLRDYVMVNTMASKMCLAWSKILPFLHPDGHGKQIQHDPVKVSFE